MLRALLLVITSLTFMQNAGAQDTLSSFTYFNKVYGNDTSNWGSRIGLETNLGYLTIGFWGGIDTSELQVRLIDQEGSITHINSFTVQENFANCYTGASIHQQNDSTFVFINCYWKSEFNNEDADIYFAKVNSKGEILSIKQVSSSFQPEEPKALIPLDSGGYLVVGSYRVSSGQDSRFYIAKIDSEGNKLWENNEIAGDPGGNSVAFSAVELDNGNYLVGGYAYVEGKDQDWLLATVDSNGNHINSNFYGTDEEECAMSMIKRNSNKIQLVSCGFSGGVVKMQTSFLTPSDMTIDLVNTFLPFQDAFSPWTTPFIAKNGNLLFVSRYENEEGWDQPVILELTPTGETVQAIPISPNPNKHVYVHDMRPTKDGGYLITGYEHFPSPQRSWVLKVDSLFNTCSELGCDSTVYVIDSSGSGIEDAAWKETSSFVFPNPAQDQINLQEPFVHLLQEIRLHDLEGRLLKKERIPQMDLLGLPSGLYIVEIELQDLGIHRQKLFITD